jgi:hypothetical protein
MNEKTLQETNKLLKVVIALLVRGNTRDKVASLREQIGILANLRLLPSDIAEILGRSGNYVNKELSELRKINKKK